jgi:translation initiation factor 3 subunit C
MAKKEADFFTTIEFSSEGEDSEVYLERKAKKEAHKAVQIDDPEAKAKQKRFEPYVKRVKVISEKLKIGDYVAILNELTGLLTDFEKNYSTLEKDGFPPQYFKSLIQIDEHISGLTSKDKSRISTVASKALSKLKQKVKKLIEEHATEIEEVKKLPDTDLGDSTKHSDKGSEDEYVTEESDELEDASSSEDDKESGDDETDWDRDDDGPGVDLTKTANLSRQEKRLLWLKDPEEKKAQTTTSNVRVQKEKTEKQYNVPDIGIDYNSINVTPESIHRRLTEYANTRAHVSGEKLNDYIATLLYILNKIPSTDKKKRLEVIIVLLNLKNERMRAEATNIDHKTWLEYFDFIQEYLSMVSISTSSLKGGVVSYLKGEDTKYEKKELESLLISLITTLDNDWFTLIKTCDPESIEYSRVLRDELRLLNLLKLTITFFSEGNCEHNNTGYLAFKMLEHIYFLSNSVLLTVQKICPDYPIKSTDQDYVSSLTKMIYNKIPDSNIIIKTALLESFNHAINDRYHQAKDLLLMYNVAERSSLTDVVIGSYYNRAVAALGLCAFRMAKIEECQTILEEICNSGKLKDLLNQTSLKGYTEPNEKRGLVPYHMSMSIESIESAYFVAVMINEAPMLVAQLNDPEKKYSSKLFQKLWQYYEKNVMNGPPENHRDLIYCAIKDLMKGEWRNCFNYLCQLRIWTKIHNSDSIKNLYLDIIKQQAFKSFVVSIKNTYHFLKFERLAEIFELPSSKLVSITCEMIHNNEIQAKLDSQTACLVTGKRELGDLETVSEKINQKIYSTINLNEKLFDVKFAEVNFSELLSQNDPQFRNIKKTKGILRIPTN